MGYAYYLYEAKKTIIDDIRDKDTPFINNKFADKDDYLYFPDIAGQEKVYDFGDADAALVNGIIDSSMQLFSNPDTNNYFEEKPVIVSKESILFAIEYYRNKIVNYYNCLLSDEKYAEINGVPPHKSSEERMKNNIRKTISEWTNFPPYDVNEQHERIVDSWQYEYCIFELVRILKYADWENNYLLFYGH